MRTEFLESLGGEPACRRLAEQFYARVATDPILKPLFPGKTLRCATEEFGAFLIQFLGGDEEQTQKRWWLSLKESHARFQISPIQRAAWLGHMRDTIQATSLEQSVRQALNEFFLESSAYVTGELSNMPADEELSKRWAAQLSLDDAIAAITQGQDDRATSLASHFAHRQSVFTGLLARMLKSSRPVLIRYVLESLDQKTARSRFSGFTLLHFASASGSLEVVSALLRMGTDPNVLDRGAHTPLYAVANQCDTPEGPSIVRALVSAGADPNAAGGVTRATPLHMAARRGFVSIAAALLDSGASIDARDSKGDTPLRRALNCRQPAVAQLLRERTKK